MLAGVGSSSTATSLSLAKTALSQGDGSLAVTPYYNKPPQEGLYQHFWRCAALGHRSCFTTCRGGRAVICLPETVARLCDRPEIVALKPGRRGRSADAGSVAAFGRSAAAFVG